MAVNKLNDVMKSKQGYENKKFKGTVVANNDPLGLGRVKATIPGLFEDGDLPWIGIVRSSPFGQGSSWGVYGVPELGSTIEIELQEGDATHPISFGYLQTSKHSDFDNPKIWGYEDPSGNKLVVNRNSGNFTFKHQSGSSYNFDNNGNLTVNGSGTATIKFPTIVLDGDVEVTGELLVRKLASLIGGFLASGGGTMSGDVVHTGGDFKSNGIIIHLHIHEGVHGNTTKPIGNLP